MDPSVATEVVIDKISRLEPEPIAKKIIGYMYFLGLTDDQMIRLAMGPETLIHSLIKEAKTARLLSSAPVVSPPISPTINPQFPYTTVSPRPFSSQVPTFRRMEPYWDPQLAIDQLPIHNPNFSYTGLDDPMETMKSGPSNFPCPEVRIGRNTHCQMDYPVKICHYFNKGFCKHGNNCRYLHGESFPENYPIMFGSNAYELAGEDQVFSLEKLELEIIELLISRRGHPVTIASLPLLYFAKYGKHLQAEGYLTESQRHGKPGYNLAKLLARLKNSIRLIERPHGQHAVILAEDAPKYMDIRGERNDPGPIVNGSRQIYLTFPAESTFTEEDVSNYFGTFGPVQDVRIPSQPKRMFGFVTFSTAETAKQILSKGNPHYVCGSRVLVKPYREKSKPGERKYLEKFDHPVYYQSHPVDFDPELQTSRESSRMFRRQLREEQEQEHALELELETMRLSRLQLACKPMPSQSCLGYSMNELKVPEDHHNYPSAERFNYLLDVLNSGSTGDDNPANNCSDQESGQGLNLPDSPFASVVASSISAVM